MTLFSKFLKTRIQAICLMQLQNQRETSKLEIAISFSKLKLIITFSKPFSEWSKIDKNIRSFDRISTFQTKVLKFVRHLQIGSLIVITQGLKIIMQMRLGLSHLHEHKFKCSCQDTFTTFCYCCSDEIDSSSYFLFYCTWVQGLPFWTR